MADVTHDGTVDATDLVALRGFLVQAVECLAP
jgi:hypothetical protein